MLVLVICGLPSPPLNTRLYLVVTVADAAGASVHAPHCIHARLSPANTPQSSALFALAHAEANSEPTSEVCVCNAVRARLCGSVHSDCMAIFVEDWLRGGGSE